jgi:hypothetical protein
MVSLIAEFKRLSMVFSTMVLWPKGISCLIRRMRFDWPAARSIADISMCSFSDSLAFVSFVLRYGENKSNSSQRRLAAMRSLYSSTLLAKLRLGENLPNTIATTPTTPWISSFCLFFYDVPALE